ncbi:DUF6763 family protein [Marinimicrobium sp. ABcell2]|uniref:DUF6763 family protein n=1 Tax=Marinimicrobium sp. ABcell2 TaxID=3069751 RepID=UPI0027B3592C|nr:DUF6763 family protein [Marinimicrobium sp. ABcell2]MDQ2075582.1 hypothetical protein [Marinimicrobium sp. ABcell2]
MVLHYPIIGAWYKDREEQQTFEVVAIDEQRGTVEIQYLDGAIGEFDLDAWHRLPLLAASPPEDADAAFSLSREDRWLGDQGASFSPWDDPLDHIEPELFPGTDDD